VRSYRLLQGIVALTRAHPRERADWACGLALQARSFRSRTVRRLAERAAENAATVVQLTQPHVDAAAAGQVPPSAAEDLPEVVTRRYEVGATIFRSSRPIEDWAPSSAIPPLPAHCSTAFLHHAEIIKITGKGFRMHDRRRSRSPAAWTATTA
jgi:hypothetical protein